MVFREKMIKNKAYKIVLWIILFSMGGGTLLFSPLLFKQMKSTRPMIMEVNGQGITHKMYEQRLAQEYENLALLKQRYGEYAEAFLKILGLDNPQALALERLINEELVNQVAQGLNLQLSSHFIMQKLYDPAFVVQELRDIIPIQVLGQNGLINMPALKYWLQRQGKTMEDLEQNIESALKRKIVIDLIGSSAFISPEEAKSYFASNFLKKKYKILVFPFEKYFKEAQKKAIDQKELQTFFKTENEKNKRYWIPEKRNGILWKFMQQNFAISVSDQEIDNYYNKYKQEKFLENPVQIHLRRILFKMEKDAPVTTLKEKAQKIREQLESNPANFEKLAQENSDDKETAKKGGDLGLIRRGDRDKSVWQAALRLEKDGDISGLVATQEGLEILQRVARNPATYKTLEKVKENIKEILMRQKFKQNFSDEADNLIKNESNSQTKDEKALNDFIASKKGKKENIKQQVLDESLISQKLFKTKKGTWSYFFDTHGDGFLINTTEIEKAHEPSLDMVKIEAEKDLYIKKAHEALNDALKEIESKAKGEDFESIAKKIGLEVKYIDWIKKDDTEKLEKLIKEGIPAEQLLFKSDTIGSLTAIHHNNKEEDGYLAKLEALEQLDEVLYQGKKQEINKNLYQEKKGLVSKAFIDFLNKNATIKRIEETNNGQQIPLDDIF